MLHNTVYAIYRALMFAGSLVCHQRAERSPHISGVQTPLCWRCSGILAGSCLLIIYLFARRKLPSPRLSLIFALLLPTDVFTAIFGIWGGDNTVRFVTGALWGIFGASFVLQTLPLVLRLFSRPFRQIRVKRKSANLQATPRAANSF